MNILGIDFGLRKTGIALSSGSLAEPYKVLRHKNTDSLITQISRISRIENIEKIVIGVSENRMKKNTKNFTNELKKKIKIPIILFDETLTTHDAIKLSIEAGIKRTKRKALEDAIAASIMLQNYLDSTKMS